MGIERLDSVLAQGSRYLTFSRMPSEEVLLWTPVLAEVRMMVIGVGFFIVFPMIGNLLLWEPNPVACSWHQERP